MLKMLEVPTLKEALEDAGGNEILLKEMSDNLRQWLKQQLHLPQDISDQRLRFFVCSTKFNLEKAKKRLDLYYTLRHQLPEVADLDPLSDAMLQCYKCVQMVCLPKCTPENCRILILRITNSDPSLCNPTAWLRYAFMSLEVLAEEDIVTSDFMIFDFLNFRFGHALKLTPSVLGKINKYLEVHGRRIKAIHMINAPKMFNLAISVIKSVISTKIVSRIHVHTSGIESLHGVIPMSILPTDYGGEQPSIDTMAALCCEELASRRKWFLEQEKVHANESLRSK